LWEELMVVEPERIRGHCPECGPARWAAVRGHHKTEENSGPVWAQTDHRILQCLGCDTVYHQSDFVFSEDEIYYYDNETGEDIHELRHTIEHWPSPLKRKRPTWLTDLALKDSDLHDLLHSVYIALDNDLGVLAAIGLRTVFDRATEVLGIDPAKRFDEKLSSLKTEGYVGVTEIEILSALTDAGSAAAHRGWKPSSRELDTMMSISEGFLQRTMLIRDEALTLKAAVPSKPKRISQKSSPPSPAVAP
jgi:hypothetical protein